MAGKSGDFDWEGSVGGETDQLFVIKAMTGGNQRGGAARQKARERGYNRLATEVRSDSGEVIVLSILITDQSTL